MNPKTQLSSVWKSGMVPSTHVEFVFSRFETIFYEFFIFARLFFGIICFIFCPLHIKIFKNFPWSVITPIVKKKSATPFRSVRIFAGIVPSFWPQGPEFLSRSFRDNSFKMIISFSRKEGMFLNFCPRFNCMQGLKGRQSMGEPKIVKIGCQEQACVNRHFRCHQIKSLLFHWWKILPISNGKLGTSDFFRIVSNCLCGPRRCADASPTALRLCRSPGSLSCLLPSTPLRSWCASLPAVRECSDQGGKILRVARFRGWTHMLCLCSSDVFRVNFLAQTNLRFCSFFWFETASSIGSKVHMLTVPWRLHSLQNRKGKKINKSKKYANWKLNWNTCSSPSH